MLDQATRLRELAAAHRARAELGTAVRRTRAIAVTSGKGGVGKTNLSVNLGQALVQAGREVIVLDADLGLANAEILLGASPPYHLGHLLRGAREIDELIHRTPTGLQLIAGGSGLSELAHLSPTELQPFFQAMDRLSGRADYLILDTGAGVGPLVMEFALAADHVLVVTTPEPTALADAYAMIKAVALRHPRPDLKLIINQAAGVQEAESAVRRLAITSRKFLGLEVEHLGTVPRDPRVWEAVRRQSPFSVEFPGAPASRAVAAMAHRLLGHPPASTPQSFFQRLAHLLLDRISPTPE